jgi:hypothetical protein
LAKVEMDDLPDLIVGLSDGNLAHLVTVTGKAVTAVTGDDPVEQSWAARAEIKELDVVVLNEACRRSGADRD